MLHTHRDFSITEEGILEDMKPTFSITSNRLCQPHLWSLLRRTAGSLAHQSAGVDEEVDLWFLSLKRAQGEEEQKEQV